MVGLTGPAGQHDPQYSVTIREGNSVIENVDGLRDPFVHTTIHVRGWRNALRVLFRRYHATVIVNADPLTVERVMHLHPDYLPMHGARRDAWNRELQEHLSALRDDEDG